jgi:protein-L-isoaspartate(D-aspartate) O-methyltransferase
LYTRKLPAQVSSFNAPTKDKLISRLKLLEGQLTMGARISYFAVGIVGLLIFCCLPAPGADSYEKARAAMVGEIEEETRYSESFLHKRSLEKQTMEALRKVPRHLFVPADQIPFAYKNEPLPIGYGQTISQPFIVAIMTDLLQLKPEARVLEIGTGSGYQAAILAVIVKEVYTIEIIGALASQASERFHQLGYQNIKGRHGDGYYGWQTYAPFDGIVVTAAADHIPPPLIQQLKPGGKMVIPVGGKFTIQQLVLVEKDEKSKVRIQQIVPVQFVPLTGGQ